MSRSYQSNWETVGSSADPDIVYYNASIINNNTDDQLGGYAFQDPLVRFNETRAQPIVRDASQYQFSIIRFVVNGPNKDLPLFIPAIQSGTGQTDVNLTEYGLGLSASIPVTLTAGGDASVNLCSKLVYIDYEPEIVNTKLAPIPNPTSNQNFIGEWDNINAYKKGDIVVVVLVINQDTGEVSEKFYVANVAVPVGTELNASYTTDAGLKSPYWSPTSSESGRPQDVSTRYYWVLTFQHWVNLVNKALETANLALYDEYVALSTTEAYVSDFATYATWLETYPTPQLNYDIPSGLFNFVYPSSYQPSLADTFGSIGLWLNQNLEGLLSNFLATYYNTPLGDDTMSQGLNPRDFPSGFVYKMTVQTNTFGTNTFPTADIVPASTYKEAYWVVMTQECKSTSTLWSPIESLVFISTLLPLQNEQVAPPNAYGAGNIGNSSATAPSAFQPIITDIANDLSIDPFAYRKMIYYAPTAEYRMTDFQNSKTEIKSIDIQVFWKNRLNNQLYPLSMYNLSSVSLKMIFRKKNAFMNMAKSERTSLY